jgi:hypothetical protein
MFAAIDNIPGQSRAEIWAQVALRLEQDPGGACYRGYRIQWVAAGRPGAWLHEVNRNADWRFDSLEAALLFIDVLEI